MREMLHSFHDTWSRNLCPDSTDTHAPQPTQCACPHFIAAHPESAQRSGALT